MKNMVMVFSSLLFLFISGCSSEKQGQEIRSSFNQNFWVEEYAQGLEFPWGMAWLPNSSLLVTERLGKIKLISVDGEISELQGVPEVLTASPFDGLLDIKIDPDFNSNSQIYLTYTTGTASARTGIVYKAKLSENTLVDGREIFRTSPPAPTGGPNITRIKFLLDKSMLVAVGSSGNPGSGMVQRLDGNIGKMLRLNRDGSIPNDNPYQNTNNARPELWAVGLRSVGGMVVDEKNRVWAMDMGPQGGDELNLIVPGRNYGWPIVTWGFYYSGDQISTKQSASEFDDPINVWSPSISPFGLALYNGNAFPNWQGDFFVGAMGDQSIIRLKIQNNEVIEQERLINDLNERIRSIEVGPDGLIYALTDSSKGKIIRLRPGKPDANQLDRVAKAVPMASNLKIADILEEHGVMQTEETIKALYTPYDEPKAKMIFRQQCSSCHNNSITDEDKIGPNLYGVIGRKSGSDQEYSYSRAFNDRSTQIFWNVATLAAFLSNPIAYYPGNKMMAPALDYGDALQVATLLEKTNLKTP